MVVAGIPGLALAFAVGGKVAVVVVVIAVGLAPPVGREVVRDSSLVVLVGRGIRVVLLGSGTLDRVVGNEAEGFPIRTAEDVSEGRLITFCLGMGSKLSGCFAL